MGGASPELPLILSTKSKSGYLGVSKIGNSWSARVGAGTSGQVTHLGTFNTAEEAAAAYVAHVAELRTNVTCDDVHQACPKINMTQVRNVQGILDIKNFKTAFQDPDGDVKRLEAAKQQQAAKRHLVYADATVKTTPSHRRYN